MIYDKTSAMIRAISKADLLLPFMDEHNLKALMYATDEMLEAYMTAHGLEVKDD